MSLLSGLLILPRLVAANDWDLSRDFHAGKDTGADAWCYYSIDDGCLDGSYDRLTRFARNLAGHEGFHVWHRPERSTVPFIAKNITDRPIDLWGPGQGTVPPDSVVVSPDAPRYGRFHAMHVAIGWKSPLDGRVDIQGRLYMAPDARDAGYGVDWYLDRGEATSVLASGTLAIGDNTPEKSDSIALTSVPVRTGEVVYLIVAARDWIELDTTIVSLNISESRADTGFSAPRSLVAEGRKHAEPIPEEIQRRLAAPELARRPYPWSSPITPPEPDTRDLSTQEAQAILEQDWLFQADGRPTCRRARQEIEWARQLAARLARNPQTPSLSQLLAELTRLDELLAAIERERGETALVEGTYFEVRRVKRRVAFANPVIDFSQLVLVDGPYPQGMEWEHQCRHRNGMLALPGGRLLVLDGLHPGGHVRKLAAEKAGSFWRPDVSFDGKRVLYCYKAHDEKSFHLHEINIDGTGHRQLTFSDYDDLDPIYLPDGHIMFTTTRCNTYVRCSGYSYSYILARCDGDGRNVYLVSQGSEPDWLPSLLHDGRVIYSRWEYTDKALWRMQSLWTTNPDGTGTVAFWGNQSVWPDHLAEPRAIPGSHRVMFTGTAHHDWYAGSIGIIDPSKGFNFPVGLTKVTADVPWPEVPKPPTDPMEADDYHESGVFTAYKSPYPLSEEDFLVSARIGKVPSRAGPGHFALYLMDVHGNRELIYRGHYNVWHALPLRSRDAPPRLLDRVAWPGTGSDREPPEMGTLYSADVCQGVSGLPRELVKYVRVLQMDPRTYTSWTRDGRFEGPVVSVVQDDGVKRVLGTTPVREDGSVYFKVPPGKALHFQLLDDEYRALHTMRSFTGVMPGEHRGCVGCHEMHSTVPVGEGLALRGAPADLTPPPWGTTGISYERHVQPVLDKYCGKCHQGDGEARQDFDLTLRESGLQFREKPNYSQLRPAVFKEPYLSLIGYAQYNFLDIPEGPPGIAGALMLENFDKSDPTAYQTLEPMKHLSYTSRLIELASSGEHYGVKADAASVRQLTAWVDAICPYRGDEDIRALPDPDFPGIEYLPIRPRVRTAPDIPRP